MRTQSVQLITVKNILESIKVSLVFENFNDFLVNKQNTYNISLRVALQPLPINNSNSSEQILLVMKIEIDRAD